MGDRLRPSMVFGLPTPLRDYLWGAPPLPAPPPAAAPAHAKTPLYNHRMTIPTSQTLLDRHVALQPPAAPDFRLHNSYEYGGRWGPRTLPMTPPESPPSTTFRGIPVESYRTLGPITDGAPGMSRAEFRPPSNVDIH